MLVSLAMAASTVRSVSITNVARLELLDDISNFQHRCLPCLQGNS